MLIFQTAAQNATLVWERLKIAQFVKVTSETSLLCQNAYAQADITTLWFHSIASVSNFLTRCFDYELLSPGLTC